jgi:hypothetical protein
VSSPWPDRIEVTEIQKTGDEEYEVMGNIIEVTSAGERRRSRVAAERPITLTVVKSRRRVG